MPGAYGLSVFSELGDPVGDPGDAAGHASDGPIEQAAAPGLDGAFDFGVAGLAEGGVAWDVMVARPRGDRLAVCDGQGELGFLA